MSDNGKVVGVGVLMAVGGFCLGAQLGFLTGKYGCRKEFCADAVKHGVARWEMESQENPAVIFKWLPPQPPGDQP